MQWPLPCFVQSSVWLIQSSASTVLCFYSPLLLQSSASTVLCFYSPLLLQSSASTVLCFYSPLLLQSSASTVLCFYCPLLLQSSASFVHSCQSDVHYMHKVYKKHKQFAPFYTMILPPPLSRSSPVHLFSINIAIGKLHDICIICVLSTPSSWN